MSTMTSSTKIKQWWPQDYSSVVDTVAKSFNTSLYPVDGSGENGLTTDEKVNFIRSICSNLMADPQNEETYSEPFYVVDLTSLEYQFKQWVELLPRVRPFYAVKCNGDEAILKTLLALGAGFDCASKHEFDKVISYGASPKDDIIFANPCKQIPHMKAACRAGIEYVTFDNIVELRKIKASWPDAKVVLRIVTDDSASLCEFSSKFGAQLSTVPRLISTCVTLELNLVGVSFHVGSGCGNPMTYDKAVRDARWVFDQAKEQGIEMNFLDLGGGYPGDLETKPSFSEIVAALTPALDECFPVSSGVKIIAEPGRYFACASHTLASNIFAKREVRFKEDEGDDDEHIKTELQYYVNDGVYQSFNCLYFDHAIVDPLPLCMDPEAQHGEKQYTTIFGPTCDGLDTIARRIKLPEMQVDDWCVFRDFGAYTRAASSNFNGFGVSKVFYIRSRLSKT